MNRLAVLPAVAAAAMLFASSASAQLYTSATSTGNWLNTTGTAGRWSPSSGGPFGGNFVSGSDASFTTSGTYTFDRLVTTGSATLGNITTGSNVSIHFTTSSGQSMNFGGAGGAVRTLDFGAGSLVDFGSIAIVAGNGITKNGAGTLALTGGLYSGGFTLNAGSVVARGSNALGNGALTINGGAIGSAGNFVSPIRSGGITVGGDFQIGTADSPASDTANMTFSAAGNGINLGGASRRITLGSSGSMTFGQIISNGNLTLTRLIGGRDTSAGQFALTAANTMSSLTIDSVQVNVSGNNAALGAGDVTLKGASASTLNIRSGLIVSNNFAIDNSAGTKTIANFGSNATISGTITNSDSTGGLTIGAGSGRTFQIGAINGNGTTGVTFGNSTLNGIIFMTGTGTYAGDTRIDSSTLRLNGDNAIPSGKLVFQGTGAPTLDLFGTTQTINVLDDTTTAGTIRSSGLNVGTIVVGDSSNQTFQGTILSANGNVALQKVGSGTLSLTGANTFTGGVTVTDGTLEVSTTSLKNQAVTNNAVLLFSQGAAGDFAGNITGTGSLTKNGAGVLALSGNNSYAGGTTVDAGGLIGTTDSLQGNIATAASTSVAFDQSTAGTYAGVMSGDGSLSLIGDAEITLTGANSYTGGTTVNGGTLQGTTGAVQGDIVNNTTVVFTQTSNGLPAYSGNMSGGGVLIKTGAYDLTLSGSNSYTGGTTLVAGNLVGTTDSLYGTITGTTGTFVKFDQNYDGIYGGEVVGAGGLIKSGTGSVTLVGDQFYTGATTVTGGTLLLAGDQATSGIDVGLNGTIGGTANITGLSVLLDVNGGLSPGDAAAPGSLEAAGIRLWSTSITTLDLQSDGTGGPGAAGTDYDTVISRGIVSLDGNLVIRFDNANLYESYSYFDLFQGTIDFSANGGHGFAGITTTGTGPYSGLTFTYQPAGNGNPGGWASGEAPGTDGQFLLFKPATGQIVIVPEPSTWAMTLASVGFAGWMARRKKLARKRRMA